VGGWRSLETITSAFAFLLFIIVIDTWQRRCCSLASSSLPPFHLDCLWDEKGERLHRGKPFSASHLGFISAAFIVLISIFFAHLTRCLSADFVYFRMHKHGASDSTQTQTQKRRYMNSGNFYCSQQIAKFIVARWEKRAKKIAKRGRKDFLFLPP
jgi:hypothetical protein